jgi:tetratricopeptide (TPR) repeat protein
MVSIDRQAVGAYRYRLLDTVRDYAHGRAQAEGTAGEMRQRHFDVFYERFRDSQRIMRGSEQLPRLRQLHVERDNVRAALEWGLASPARAEASVELAGALFWYWTKCGLFEEGKRWLKRAVALGASPRIQARAFVGLAHMFHFQGDQAPVVDLGVQTVSLGRKHGDAWATSVGWFLQALASFELGQLDQARAAALSALEAADVHGEIVERGGPLMVLANLALAHGDQDEALRLFDESIDVHRRGGDAWGLSILLSVAAGLRVVRDDFARARAQATEALTLCRALDDPRGTAWSLEVFAGLLAAAGRLDDAARTWGLSDALVGTSGGALTATIGWIRDRYIERVRHALGDPAFDCARRDGSRMSVDAVTALLEAEPATLQP